MRAGSGSAAKKFSMPRMVSKAALAAALLSISAAPVFAASPPPNGRLQAAPATLTSFVPPARSETIELPNGARAYLPARIGANGPAPLLVLLHGTGGSGTEMLDASMAVADRLGIILLAPSARRENWDAIDLFFDDYEAGKRPPQGGWFAPEFGADLGRLDEALAALFARAPVDPGHVGILGFSHGASYALMVGTANPQLFESVIALSPGILVIGDPPPGGPRIFVSHGTRDPQLPFSRTRDGFVPRLEQLGYQVAFRPFEGRHEVPAGVADDALAFFLAKAAASAAP